MTLLWIGFIIAVLILVALDLFVFHRKDKVMSVKAALGWSAVWISLALGFNVAVFFMYREHWMGLGTQPSALHANGLGGWEAAVLFFTGYLVEQSLSIDNLFVMAVIFNYFAIPAKYQHRVLFWGIIGVLVMRGVMIGVGTALIRFEWVLYLFGGILLYTAYKMLFGGGETDPKKNPLLKFVRKFFPVTHEIHGHHFAVRWDQLKEARNADVPVGFSSHAGEDASVPTRNADVPVGSSSPAGEDAGVPRADGDARAPRHGWVLTPLALALVVIETTDVIFAVDSIPAIFAITSDPFLVFTSNVCAVLGLRSLYFALAGILEKFEYLKVSLAAILALVGVKMLLNDPLEHVQHIHLYMLGGVALLLGGGVVASLMLPPKKKEHESNESHESPRIQHS